MSDPSKPVINLISQRYCSGDATITMTVKGLITLIDACAKLLDIVFSSNPDLTLPTSVTTEVAAGDGEWYGLRLEVFYNNNRPPAYYADEIADDAEDAP